MVDAIAGVETSSSAQGTLAADAMVKTAEVELLEACPISPGKYWVLIGGDVGPVRHAFERGLEVAGDTTLDHLFIPQLHEQVLAALRGVVPAADHDALGIIETLTAAAAIVAGDPRAKAAARLLRALPRRTGLGGKGVLFLSGDVSGVQAAVEAGRAEAMRRGLLARSVVIPRLHAQVKARVF